MAETTYLNQLEAESIFILREVAGQFSNPSLLFSGGKDSICLVHLALKAFRPGKFPFPLVHIDTGHNFPEALSFRDNLVSKIGEKLIVRKVEDTLIRKNIPDAKGKFPSRNALQTHTLLETIKEFQFDACVGGARRDEEKARAKERIFSVRDKEGKWNPKLQRPELWNCYNGRIQQGENVRVFPLSNWTELDIWNYIKREQIELPPLYFAHKRTCVVLENNILMANSAFLKLDKTDILIDKEVRFRTVGDMTCTAAVESQAETVDDIIEELLLTKISERGATRMDDRTGETAMEDRKRGGYF